MVRIALALYDFFQRRKAIFRVSFVLSILLVAFGASRITIEEDISKFFPESKKAADLSYVFRNAKFTEQLVIMVSIRDSASVPDPDSLVARAERIGKKISNDLKPYIGKLTTQVDDERVLEMFSVVQENVPVFLTEPDFEKLDTLLTPDGIGRALKTNHDLLLSPAGLALKRIIIRDPVGISFLPLKRLQELQFDKNLELYDGYVTTRDHRHVLLFISPLYPPSDTGRNIPFITGLADLLDKNSDGLIQVSFFGAPAVAVGNALQLRNDSILTTSLLVVLLGIFLIWFFRRKHVVFLILIPVVFGGLFSLCCIWLIKSSVSILALAAGSVVLGIAVNYALHFLAHQKHINNVRLVIKELTGPMTIGNFTTVVAFFCLHYANAPVLRDIGLFAGFSLIGAAFSSLIFLPHFIPADFFSGAAANENAIERISFDKLASKKLLIVGILVLTPVFFYFAGKVSFNSDVADLNFMDDKLIASQRRLESINQATQNTVFVVSRERDLEHALRKTEQAMPVLEMLKKSERVQKFSAVSSFLISDSLQRMRIQRWRTFWNPEKTDRVIQDVEKKARELKFSETVIANFKKLIVQHYIPMDDKSKTLVRSSFFDDYIIDKDSTTTVISLANVPADQKASVYESLANSNIHAFDRQQMATMFVEFVNADFNFIVMFTAALVFLALLVSYGRIELTVITFVPMFLTWIWILGIMGMIGIRFNIVNVMVSTFIFGLGDDYSIFIMDGLQKEYAVGRKTLPSIRTSIFLSAITTIAGLSVLFFAHHPAMRSIAAISIIGIVSVFVMAQTIEPWLFRLLITNRTKNGLPPRTWSGMLGTLASYGLFLTGAILMPVIGFALRSIPFQKKRLKYFFHWMLSPLARLVIYFDVFIRKRYIGRTRDTLKQPSIVIANHSSVIDILLTIMLQPKVILVTNEWVWKSPILGGVARMAGYHSVVDSVETGHEKFQALADDGYSIVIFPEGTRSDDGKIKRFHKGAFFLAEKLKMPIQPLLLHGPGLSSPKGTFYLSPSQFTLKFLPVIRHDDPTFGSTYSERTKQISRYFKSEHAALSREIETPEFFSSRLILNYIYKGPVLEWYLRVKFRLEKNYRFFYERLPREGALLDLGCGYGFLSTLLHLREPEQPVIGVDYDEEKIDTASHGFLCTPPLQFFNGDIRQWNFDRYAGIVLSDVLHYLCVDDQWKVIAQCCDALLPGGILIIQDGNIADRKNHSGTRVSEFFSIHVLGFNKASTTITFLDSHDIIRFVEARGLTASLESSSTFTSNVLIVIYKPQA